MKFLCRGQLYPEDRELVNQLLAEQKFEEAKNADRDGRRRWCLDNLNSPVCNYELNEEINRVRSQGKGEYTIVCPRCGNRISVRVG